MSSLLGTDGGFTFSSRSATPRELSLARRMVMLLFFPLQDLLLSGEEKDGGGVGAAALETLIVMVMFGEVVTAGGDFIFIGSVAFSP